MAMYRCDERRNLHGHVLNVEWLTVRGNRGRCHRISLGEIIDADFPGIYLFVLLCIATHSIGPQYGEGTVKVSGNWF